MIMLQTGSGGGGEGQGSLNWANSRALTSWRKSSTTFRDTPWIQRLNAMLQRELAAVDVYEAAPTNLGLVARSEIITRHQDSGRELVRLIVSHRGLPADRTSSFHGRLTRTVLQMHSAFGGYELSKRIAGNRLIALEESMLKAYDGLIRDAMPGDREVLLHVRHLTSSNAEALESFMHGGT